MKTRTLNIVAIVYFALTISLAILLGSCASSGHTCDAYSWEDSIENPDNAEFIIEVAFNEGVAPEEVTQIMFNQRYSH